MSATEELHNALKQKYPYFVWNLSNDIIETYFPNRNTNMHEIVKFNIQKAQSVSHDNDIQITLSDNSGTKMQYLSTDMDSNVNRISEALSCWLSRWILN